MRSLLVVALVCLAFAGANAGGWSDWDKKGPTKPDKPWVHPPKDCGCSITAWAYITSQPSLSAVAGLLQTIGLDKALQGPFTGTLVLPTNDAVAAYTAQFKGDVTAFPDIFSLFLTKLLNYHFILRSAPAWQLDTINLSTRYISSWTAKPHTVQFVVDKDVSKRAPKSWQWSRKNMKNRPMPRVYAVDYIVDEQGNNVTFAAKDAYVLGGGVIHQINAVLNAYDIYPSVTAAGEANPELSTLLGALAQVSAALNISVIDQIENTPGTLAAPTNEAIEAGLGALPITPTPEQLYAVLQYHFCPTTSPKGLLSFKFTDDPKFNPCLTLLGIEKPVHSDSLKLKFNQALTQNNVLLPMTLTIDYLDLTSASKSANIILPDVTCPLLVGHVIDTVLTPPLGALPI